MNIKITDGSTKIIGRGILLLLAIIIIGIMAAETQLNSLTKSSEFVQFINMRHMTDSYCFYVFGNSYQVSAVKYLGKISNTDSQIAYQAGDQQIIIPTKLAINVDEALRLAEKKQQYLSSYFQELRRSLQDSIYKIKTWQKELKRLMNHITGNFT